MNIRNIAVIAHVDHGKTTLIDALLKQTHTFRDNQDEMSQERIMDSNDLERERGITIKAKNCSIEYKDIKINIIDTPGHADFSGEVERTLSMADGALLIVDAQEGPMPQTRFVLKKALELGLNVMVIVNKIDKPFADIPKTNDRLADLFLELATTEEQLEFLTLYSIAKDGNVFTEIPEDYNQPADVIPLLDAIIEKIPSPHQDDDKPFKMVVSSLDYDNHLGKIIIGKIHQGVITPGKRLVVAGSKESASVDHILVGKGLDRIKTDRATSGDIVGLTGFKEVQVGQTVADPSDTTPLPSIEIGEPTLHMRLGPNTSPFAGKEGQFTTSRQIAARLDKELETNVSLRVEPLEGGSFQISGRGELHLSILLETMRREGYEMEVGKPEVITRDINGTAHEPVEEVSIIVPKEFEGVINQEFGRRFGALLHLDHISDSEVEFTYKMPTRALIGLRGHLLTQTKGTIIMSSQVIGYEPVGKPVPKTRTGVIISATTGTAVTYSLKQLKGRGSTLIQAGTKVYEGMLVGQNSKDEDIEMNVTKEKQLTNHRTKSHQGITQMAPDLQLSLEESLDFLETDELLEVTPESLRLRKKHLTEIERRRSK